MKTTLTKRWVDKSELTPTGRRPKKQLWQNDGDDKYFSNDGGETCYHKDSPEEVFVVTDLIDKQK